VDVSVVVVDITSVSVLTAVVVVIVVLVDILVLVYQNIHISNTSSPWERKSRATDLAWQSSNRRRDSGFNIQT
jgi:hypothetical protein